MDSQNLNILKVGYNSQTSQAVLAPGNGQQLKINAITLFNGSGGSCDMAVGVKLDTDVLHIQDYFYPGPTYTEIDFSVTPEVDIFRQDGNDALAIRARQRFDQVILNITNFSTQHTQWFVDYGEGQVSTTPLSAPTTTGIQSFILNIPADWVPDNEGFYSIRIYEAINNNTSRTKFDSVSVLRHIAYRPGVATKQQMKVLFTGKPYKLESREEIVPYFSSADDANMVEISYQIDS